MDRTAYYVKYKSGEPVEINSIIFLKHNGIPLTTVGHLIMECRTQEVKDQLGLSKEPGPLTLHSVIDGVETKHNSYDKITDIKEAAGTGPNPLIIYAKQISENEQTHQKPSEELNTEGIERDMMEKITLHDMQQDTAIIEKIKGNDSVVYLGKTNEQKLSNEGINLDDEKTVKREETVKEIILQLKETGVLLIKSPPMTGKTSLATLAADYLCNVNDKEKKLIINISMVDFNNRVDNWDFQQTFYKELGIRWGDLADYRKVREIYLIMDEVQLLYTRNGNNADNRPFSPSHNSRCVWNMVKSILGGYDGVNILLFAAYGSSVQNLEFSTPVKLEEGRTMFGITWTIFKDDELQEYVRKHLRCYNSVLHKDKQAMNEFCFNIQKLTGSYVGLVRDAIIAINDEFISDEKRFTIDVKKLIKSVWMQRVYKKLLDTRAIRAVKNIVNNNDLELVKSLLFGDSSMELDEMNTSLVKNWVLVETNKQLEFASTIMEKYFTEKIIGEPCVRATNSPVDINEMILCVLSTISYNHLMNTKGKTKKTGILLGRSWQSEFIKAIYQCTTKDMYISSDVGGIYECRGFIDFTVHSEETDIFWGIELLREADKFDEHIGRFKDNGRYELLSRKFTDYCMIDFRKVNGNPKADDLQIFKDDLAKCNGVNLKLYVLFYDEDFNLQLFSYSNPSGTQIQQLY